MNKKQLLVACVVFLLVILIIANVAKENGLVMSILPEILLSRTLSADIHYEDADLWGVRFRFERNKTKVGSVRIGIFPDQAKAADMLDKALLLTAVGPDKDLSGKIGDDAAAWSTGRIVFCRDNVFVDLYLPDFEIEGQAARLDTALSKTGVGVRRGSSVKVPKILDVEIQDYKPKVKLSIKRDGYTFFVDEYDRDVTAHFNAAKEVCFVTKDCVMSTCVKISSSLFKKDVVPEEPVDINEVQEHIMILENPNTSKEMRNKAILALMNLKDKSAVPVLIAHVEGDYGLVVRQNAIRALGAIGNKQGVSPLLNILKRPVKGNITDEAEDEAILRRNAVLALGEIGDASALPTLEALAQERSEYQSVREFAVIAANKIKGKIEVSESKQDATATTPRYMEESRKLTIKSDKEVYGAGDEIKLVVEIKNLGETAYIIKNEIMEGQSVDGHPVKRLINLGIHGVDEKGNSLYRLRLPDVSNKYFAKWSDLVIQPRESYFQVISQNESPVIELGANVIIGDGKLNVGQHRLVAEIGTVAHLVSNTITIEVREKNGQSSKSDKQGKIIQAILREIIEHYKFLEAKGQGPKEISIAQVDTKKDDILLHLDSHILKHWMYKDGKLSESKPSVREQIMKENAYWNEPGERFYKIGLITFAIFSDNEGQTVQIDESWEGKYGSGVLYRIETTPEGEIKLRQIRPLWIS